LPWRADLWQQAGLSALGAGDYSLAANYLGRAQSLGKLDAAGAYALGEAHWLLNQQQAALQVWETLQANGTRHAPTLARLAEIYEAEADFNAAMAARRAQLDLTPTDAAARLRLGLMLAAQADPAALTELTRAAQDNPALEPTTRSVRTALNTAFLQPDAAYQLTAAGRGLAEAGEWALAQASFIRAIEANRPTPKRGPGWVKPDSNWLRGWRPICGLRLPVKSRFAHGTGALRTVPPAPRR
jgi:tetratricopeptide (TPR) repeat protein